MGQASTLFNGTATQTLINRVSPTSEQRQFLQQSWNDLAEHLKTALKVRHGYAISTWLQGSYKYATLIKPVHSGEEYDVDVGVYFEWGDEQDATPTPKQLRDWVQAELLRFAENCEDLKTVEERWRRDFEHGDKVETLHHERARGRACKESES